MFEKFFGFLVELNDSQKSAFYLVKKISLI